MAVIQPCHYCSRPVTSDEHFAHNVVCAKPECQEQKRAADERMQRALDRTSHSPFCGQDGGGVCTC